MTEGKVSHAKEGGSRTWHIARSHRSNRVSLMTEGRVSHTKEGRVSQMTDCKSHRSNRISQDRSLVGRVFQKAASHSSWKGRNRADFRQTFDNINEARKTQLTGRAGPPPPPVHPRPLPPASTPP